MTTFSDALQRVRYEFDKSMAAGPIALIGWLGVATFVVIVIAGDVIAFGKISQTGNPPMGFIEAAWESLMRTMDSGAVGGDQGWPFRLVMLVVTVWGIFVVSALIGLLSAGVQSKLDDLRKGRSLVLERDHTIILNWSNSVFDVIAQLAVAHAKHRKLRIAVMANKDKVEMEDEIAAKVDLPANTQVICRSGDPSNLYDLAIANPEASKSIIVLSPDARDPDSQVMKTVLALVHNPKRRAAPYRIAAEFRTMRNAEVAQSVGGAELQMVLADDLISRIIVHSSRQAGLSAVYSELLDFEGSEIYTTQQGALVGKSFGQAMMSYDNSALIGFCDESGRVALNPPEETVFTKGMRAILIAEDFESIAVSESAPQIAEHLIQRPHKIARTPERTLVLGWNRRGKVIVSELSRFVAPGSILTVAADTPDFERDITGLALTDNLRVDRRTTDITHHAALEALDIPSYDHVIVLACSDSIPAEEADTQTLVCLLHLRHIAERAGNHIGVVSEMADVRNRELAEITRADDFVVSNKLVSLMLAQASENEFLSAIFKEILSEEGSEIYMRPAEDYVAMGHPVDFFTVVEAGRRRGETAFGYCRRRDGLTYERNMGGVVLNPRKSTLETYQPGDFIVVLAQF
jgi:ion channel POLLUX/CASTOR